MFFWVALSAVPVIARRGIPIKQNMTPVRLNKCVTDDMQNGFFNTHTEIHSPLHMDLRMDSLL